MYFIKYYKLYFMVHNQYFLFNSNIIFFKENIPWAPKPIALKSIFGNSSKCIFHLAGYTVH